MPRLSYTGRYVALGSGAGNLVNGDDEEEYDGFVADMKIRAITSISEGLDGSGGNNRSATTDIAVSGEGQTVVHGPTSAHIVESFPPPLAQRPTVHRPCIAS